MKVTLFDNDWYSSIISQTLQNLPRDTSADAVALATALLVGCATIAQAIDGPTPQTTAAGGLNEIANTLGRIADIHERPADPN
ncbi:hypothetical protein LCGC14_0583180 [marine sediment metagenome]|uniref:Uncharacterized protein n=1 Tax=marine sediment metagenome TaxID=412755 RepID=A0A0F9UNZ7_9ZZZZ